jgi:hypothetical protein
MLCRPLALFVALCALLAPSAAWASSQSLDDPDDGVAEAFYGKQLDVRHVELSQGSGQTWVDVTIEYEQRRLENDALWVGFDTNFDGKGDYVARLRGFSYGDPSTGESNTASLAVYPAAAGTSATCLQIDGFTHADDTVPVPGPDAGGKQVLGLRFPTSAIGGAESYRWGIYAQNDSLSRSSFDYAPNAGNPKADRPNPAPQELDGCDDDGDGAFGESGERTTNVAAPLSLAGGAVRGTAPGGGQQPGPGPEQPQPENPRPGPTGLLGFDFSFLSKLAPVTLRTVPMPDVSAGTDACRSRRCTIDTARKVLAKAGVRDFKLVERNGTLDEVLPKSLRKNIEHGDITGQSPGPGEPFAVTNVAAYPGAPLPTISCAPTAIRG